MKAVFFFFIFTISAIIAFGQDTKGTSEAASQMFTRIADAAKNYIPDTSDVPNDKITAKIIKLRKLRGNFNINEAIAFKVEEDRQKKEISPVALDKISEYFKSGEGRRLLDNTVIWIYRRQFTSRELSQMIRFYKTGAGQKMAADFPIIMLETIKAGEMIQEKFTHENNITIN